MHVNKNRDRIRIWRTTAIGGLFFLLPLIVLGALIGQLVPVIMAVSKSLAEFLPLKTPAGISLLVGISILLILLICFVAGVFARRSIGMRLGAWFEKNIGLMFPRYTIIKEQMRGSIGGSDLRPEMKPILIQFHDCQRIGFEVERTGEDWIAVFLPGSPDAWTGSVAIVKPEQVRPLHSEFWDTILVFGELGRGTGRLLESRAMDKGSADPAD